MSKAEIAMFVGMAIIVASIVFPSWAATRMQARLSEARADILEMLTAGERFFSEYRSWPSAHTGEFGDQRYGSSLPNFHVVNVLRAVEGPGNEGHNVNPRRIEFLVITDYANRNSGLGDRDEYRDPWGSEYQIVIDTDFDGAVTMEGTVFGTLTGEGMAIWSYGPDLRPDTQDDIRSWQL